MKLLLDAGNGVAGACAPPLFRALGCEVEEMYCEVDGSFSNHRRDPSVPENLEDLRARLDASNAEIGLAFDGDGDRPPCRLTGSGQKSPPPSEGIAQFLGRTQGKEPASKSDARRI